MTDVAFIGLGVMGLHMANNIIKGGYSVTGYDTSSEAVQAHVTNGGKAADSAAAAAKDVEIIITMLPHGDIVHSALFAEGGAIETAPDGTLVIDMSTIHPLQTDAIRDQLRSKGMSMVDSPVGRTSVQAKTGNALFMVGAEAADLDRARPILECMGDTIIDCGGPGMGSRMKIVNNLMTTTLNVLTAEVLTFSEAVGLDRELAIQVMSGTPAGQSHMTTTYPAKVLQGDLSPAFMIDLARKDLKIALNVSEELNVPLSLASQADGFYAQAQSEGRGKEDWTAIYAMVRDNFNNNGDND